MNESALTLDREKACAYNKDSKILGKHMATDENNKAEELTQAADETAASEELSDKNSKKGKKSKAEKADVSSVQNNWRSKEKEKPLMLDKHKVILWVLVAFAILGLVMAIIPFVVK